MGGLGHCLAGVLPALGQVRDVIVRPPIRDCLGLRFRRVLEDMSMSRLPSLLIAVLSLLLSAVVACSRACS